MGSDHGYSSSYHPFCVSSTRSEVSRSSSADQECSGYTWIERDYLASSFKEMYWNTGVAVSELVVISSRLTDTKFPCIGNRVHGSAYPLLHPANQKVLLRGLLGGPHRSSSRSSGATVLPRHDHGWSI
jgi:hypothetical protein